MPDVLLFWKQRSELALSAEEIARELNWGEEVAGLEDLPVREVLDRLKAEFGQHDERPGLLVTRSPEGGSWEATWGWQFVKIELHEAASEVRQRLIDVLAEFGCRVHEA